ncbi:zinc finger CCCH domain-containing protein 7B-like isoform X2 [Corythoichthys intestinalis]|uniref:zinc finger CCCH domain-containing protein 7B-like isoform X2 n=1 Tax=Corythoichthys intestinalis TaxID=161448 RepID=UPI0025A55A22|nr:zinc finger CCCH domain-containing protein 7B-like isoform X2 [Corythoichthys intestinalis]
MDSQRQKRRKEIKEALNFIQSSVTYPDSEGYKDFLIHLICDLLEEGNSWFRDGQWKEAVREFSEGVNVAHYVKVEGFQIPPALLESLYINRAAAYVSMEEFDNGVKDCDKALELFKKSHKTLYLKAVCLKNLGKYKEAYDCTSKCLLISIQDKRVTELAEELGERLGLKKRKPYVPSHAENATAPLNDTAPGHNGHRSAVSNLDQLDTLEEDCELIGDDLDDQLDYVPCGAAAALVGLPVFPMIKNVPLNYAKEGDSLPSRVHPLIEPGPRPQLPPGFFNSSVRQFKTGHNSMDALDDLSSPQGPHSSDNIPGVAEGTTLKTTVLDSLDNLFLKSPCDLAVETNLSITDPEKLEKSLVDLLGSGVHQLDSLDTFDSFPPTKVEPTSRCVCSEKKQSPMLKDKSNTPTPISNPLAATHEFMQACFICYARLGQGVTSFVHKPELVHNCKRDVLLCRRKADFPLAWTRVRQPPTWTSFTGPFVLCKELLMSGDLGLCKFGEKCTFAFNQMEIDVWTEERKGTLDRNLLFGPSRVDNVDPVNSIIRLLQEHKGMFIFLCQECYDRKPRFISKRCRDNPTLCSNSNVRHSFDANKCLAFVVTTGNFNYRKVRPLNVLARFELCSQAISDGCLGEYKCLNAHSVIELQTWRVQRSSGITPDEIVKVSTNYHEQEEMNTRKRNSSKMASAATNSVGASNGKSLNMNMKMKFVCAKCFQNGLVSTPDRALKYCSAKAKHTWTKEQNTLLVKSLEKTNWVPVRPVPYKTKHFPLKYELCTRMMEKKKCTYSGNCPFAHSEEEKEMWMYMKTKEYFEMQQMYDIWLTLSLHNHKGHGDTPTQDISEEKDIAMPTDNAEQMFGLYCPLCQRHSNGERQWLQHISTKKHKERLFSCEQDDEALKWSYRFPGAFFELCTKSEGDCPDGASCDFAHSPEELQEWKDRRCFLRRKLASAKKDRLIMPDDVDFGKYNFILQD